MAAMTKQITVKLRVAGFALAMLGAGTTAVGVSAAAHALSHAEPVTRITFCHVRPNGGYQQNDTTVARFFEVPPHPEDIVPPFTYTDANGDIVDYPGQNWDGVGQATFGNGCVVAAAPTTTTPPTTPVTTTTTPPKTVTTTPPKTVTTPPAVKATTTPTPSPVATSTPDTVAAAPIPVRVQTDGGQVGSVSGPPMLPVGIGAAGLGFGLIAMSARRRGSRQ